MPIFHFKGINAAGKKVQDNVTAADEIALKADLADKGISLLEFKLIKEKRRSNFLAVSSRVSPTEFVTFCQEFGIMIKAGATISQCLDTLRKQKFGTVFKNAISDAYEDVLVGLPLSEALRKHKKIFPDFFCSMIYVGELSGTLPDTLSKAATYYRNSQKTKNEAKGALMYPLFLLIVIAAVIVLLMNVVIPQFNQTFEQLGAELPLITRVVISISNFFTAYWLILLGALVGIIAILALFRKTKKGKLFFNTLSWNFPLLQGVIRATAISSFASSFAIMLNSGLPVLECMKASENIVGNAYFQSKFKYATIGVNNGRRLSGSLESAGLFPPMLLEMVAVGEQSSNLPQVFNVLAEYYEERNKQAIKKFTSILEPLLIVIMAVVVLLIMLSVFLPMFDMYNSIDQGVGL